MPRLYFGYNARFRRYEVPVPQSTAASKNKLLKALTPPKNTYRYANAYFYTGAI
jgi:hypothetical protein